MRFVDGWTNETLALVNLYEPSSITPRLFLLAGIATPRKGILDPFDVYMSAQMVIIFPVRVIQCVPRITYNVSHSDR